MSEPQKIWAVSSGEYSDYSVAFVMESEEEALAIQKTLERTDVVYGGYFVETFDFYPTGSTPTPQVTWYAYGELGKMEVVAQPEVSFDEPPPKRPKTHESRLGSQPTLFTARCGDRDAAIKSVKDHLAAALAQMT